jgi:hypothetical protein
MLRDMLLGKKDPLQFISLYENDLLLPHDITLELMNLNATK